MNIITNHRSWEVKATKIHSSGRHDEYSKVEIVMQNAKIIMWETSESH